MKKVITKLSILLLLIVVNVTQLQATTMRRYYCKMQYSWWTKDNAAIGAHYWKSSNQSQTTTWPGVRMTKVTGESDVWYIDIDTDTYDRVIFTRVNGSGNIEDWGAQTNDLTLGTTNNYYNITSSTDHWGSGNKAEGSWGTYQVTSTASLSATSTSITTAETSTLTPSLSSNTTYNVIKSTSYSVTTNPGSAGSVTSAGVFSATAAGTYTVTATVTYNAKGFPGIYSSTTATRDITVTSATSWNLYNSSTNLGSFTQVGDYEYSLTVNMSTSYASLQFKKDGSEGYIVGAGDPTSTNQTLSISGGYFSWANIAGVTNGTYVLTIKSDNSGSSWYYRAAKVIQVTYDANGATSGSAPSGSSYSSGDYVSTAAQGGLTKEFYTFDGWNTKSDGTGTHYNANTSNAFQISNSVTLYAEWRPNLPSSNTLQIHGPLFTGDWNNSCITMDRTINETNHKQYKHSDVLWDGVSNSEFVFKDNNCTDFLKAKEHIMDLVTPTGCTVTSSGNEWYNFRVTTSGPKLITVTVDFYITNHSSVPNAIAIAITAETPATGYYLKHPWNGGSWCWKKLTNESGNNYILREKFGNNGCNYASYDGSTASDGWKEGNDCTKHFTGSISSGDSCLFVYNSSNDNIDIYKLYPVTFNINGATTGRAPGATSDVTNGTVNFPYGRATTVPSNAGSLAKTGCEFGGWNTNNQGTGTNYTAGSDTYTLSSSSGTLYAKWNAVVVPTITSASLVKSTIGNTETFGVTVNYANIASGSYYRIIAGAGGEYNNASGVLNQSISGTGTSNFVSQSPTITGTVSVKLYNSSNSLLQTYEVGTLTVVTTHAITVASNNNSYGTVSPTTVYAGSGYASASFTATNESHYHFVNWTKSSENFTLNNANSATTYITTANSGGTVTANFAGDEYTITYKDINNASYSGSNEGSLPATHTYGTATVLVAGVKAGYSFGGWFTDAVCTSSAGSSIGATAKTADFTLYTKWTENKVSIAPTVNSVGSGQGYTASATVGEIGIATTTVLTADAPGEGYRFSGWTLSSNLVTSDALTNRSITVHTNGDGNAVTATANYAVDTYVRLYFQNTGNWGTIDAYVWYDGHDKEEGGKNAAWPGVTTSIETICGITYNYYEFNREDYPNWDKIIFNDNGSNQTSNLDIAGHNRLFYKFSDSKWYVPTNTFYFVNTEFWDNVYVYCWKDESDYGYGGWPGTPMEKVGTVMIDGHEYDYYGVAGGVCSYSDGNYIVNNGKASDSPEKKETSSLTSINNYYGQYFVPDECFGAGSSVKPDGAWYDSDGVHSATIGCPALLPFADINTINLSASRVPPMATITATPVMNNKRAVDQAYCWGLYSDAACTSAVDVSFTSVGDGKVSFTAPQTRGTYYLKLTVRASAACDASIDDEEVQSFNVTTDNMVFFKNVPNWGSVHVYFLGASEYWNSDKGTGCQGRDWGHAYGMTRIGNSDVYYYDYTGNSNAISGYIAFTDNYKPNSEFFSGCQAAYRGDFDRTCAPMYVPENYITDYKNTSAGDGQAAYYNRGYWTKYMSDESGFTLHVYNSKTKNSGTEIFYHEMTGSVGNNTYTFTYDFANASQNPPYIYGFEVSGCGGSWYAVDADMDITSCTNYNLYTSASRRGGIDIKGKLEHTFILTLTGDGHVQLSVEYPLAVDDYRLLYTDDKPTSHPSQYIRKRANGRDTVSMFIRPQTANEILKVQRCTAVSPNITWADYEWKSDVDTIDVAGKEDGVYNFILVQDESGNLSVNTDKTAPYSGRYYIRTSSVDGGWASYKTSSDNLMTYAQYPDDMGYGFNYYKAKWVGAIGSDVTYTIACDYSPSLCDTLLGDPGDDPLDDDEAQSIPHTANVRFGWHSKTNALKREYINGSTNISDRFLVMIGDAKMKDAEGNALNISGLNANEISFTDLNNWIYRCDITAVEGAEVKLTANYNDKIQYFIGTAGEGEKILGGTGSKEYLMRVTYDFKTNRLMTAWLPNGSQIEDNITLKADMMLIREGQNAATQVYFNGNGKSISEIHTIYGVMEFQYDNIAGKFPSWSSTNAYKYLMYYISFPFDVKVSEIFGCGVRGENWIVQKYNGAKRAQIGWFAETSTFWETLPGDSTLHAYEGYLLLLDRVSFNDPSSSLWYKQGSGNSIYLYFPSSSHTSGTISEASKTIHVPEHTCTINRTFDVDGVGTVNHKNTDSHWNVIGTPLFENKRASTVTTGPTAGVETLQYYYAWNSADNTLAAQAAYNTSVEFLSMHGYMVQYAGDVTFTGAKLTPPTSVAARRLPSDQNYQIELQMVNEGGKTSRTYVELRENACDTFALNEDMYMMRSSKMVDLYSFAGNYDVAANVLSVNNHIVPVGMDVKVADMYRFTMPSEFDGSVVLIDTYTGARTNLALGDYEVNLERGTANDRFLLEINIHNAPTTIEGIEGGSLKDGKAHKFVQDGVMYILRDGKIYDARGAMVK